MEFVEYFWWQVVGFLVEDENIVVQQCCCKWVCLFFGCYGKQVVFFQCYFVGVLVGVVNDLGVFVIIKFCLLQFFVGNVEVEWFDEMQFGFGVGVKMNDIICVGWDFWLVEDDGEYVG